MDAFVLIDMRWRVFMLCNLFCKRLRRPLPPFFPILYQPFDDIRKPHSLSPRLRYSEDIEKTNHRSNSCSRPASRSGT